MLIKRLHIYILKSFLGPWVLTFFISLFILILQFIWKYIDDLVGKGLDNSFVIELFFYVTLNLVPMALLLSILLASIMTFGNLGENYELTALKSSGISLWRIMMPLIILVSFTSVFAFYFSNNILPITNYKWRYMIWDIRQQRPEISIQKGIFYHLNDQNVMRIQDKDPETNMMKDIIIYNDHPSFGNTNVTKADSGYIRMTKDKRYMEITLYNGVYYEDMTGEAEDRRNNRFRQEAFKKRTNMIYLADDGFRSSEEYYRNSLYNQNIYELTNSIDSLDDQLYERRMKLAEKSGVRLITNVTGKNTFEDSISISKDEVINSMPETNVDSVKYTLAQLDSLYKSRNSEDKINILKAAIRNTRTKKQAFTVEISSFDWAEYQIRRHWVEWHKKFTLSFACIIFFFIGAPLGAIIRKGGLGAPIVISVLFFILYYIINLTGEKMAKQGVWDVAVGMWFSSIVLFPMGIFLTYKATTDSSIMSSETYTEFLKKLNIFQFIKFKRKSVSR